MYALILGNMHLWKNFEIISQHFWEFWKVVEKTPGDFEEIVKKFHNNFGDLFLGGQDEIENQISQHLLEIPQNPSSNT